MNQFAATEVIVMSPADFDAKLSATVEAAVKKAFNSMSKKDDNDDEFFDKRNAANFLNCSASTIDKMRREGTLKSYKLGKKVLFKKSDLATAI